MDAFLAAQADSSFDPAPMLIWADHLEERGDLAGAVTLRGLVGVGVPSLHALAFDLAHSSQPWTPDITKYGVRDGFGDEFGDGAGYGDGFELMEGRGEGDGSWDADDMADDE